MTTIGFDQSYTSSGFCVIDNDGNILDFGTFKSAKATDVYDRAVQVANFLVDKIVQHNATHVNIEGLAFGIRGDATRDLAGLLFTIITTIRQLKKEIKLSIIAPTQLKKFATGSGKSDKNAMIASVPPDILSKFKGANYKKTTGLTDIVDSYYLSTYK